MNDNTILNQSTRKVKDHKIFTCSRCKKTLHPEEHIMDWQERLVISFRGGYGSVFGDGNYIEGVFCQECVDETLGPWLRVTKDDPFDPRYKSDHLAEKSLQDYQINRNKESKT